MEQPVALTQRQCVSKDSVWRQDVTKWLDPVREWISVASVEEMGWCVEKSQAHTTKQCKWLKHVYIIYFMNWQQKCLHEDYAFLFIYTLLSVNLIPL